MTHGGVAKKLVAMMNICNSTAGAGDKPTNRGANYIVVNTKS